MNTAMLRRDDVHGQPRAIRRERHAKPVDGLASKASGLPLPIDYVDWRLRLVICETGEVDERPITRDGELRNTTDRTGANVLDYRHPCAGHSQCGKIEGGREQSPAADVEHMSAFNVRPVRPPALNHAGRRTIECLDRQTPVVEVIDRRRCRVDDGSIA